MDGASNEKWMTLLRDYMINNHINHTFWGLNPNSGDTGGLLGYDFATWDDEKYGLFEESLWQTLDSGKYISLDHQRALGTDGSSISLTEFYASYADTEGSNLDGGTIGGNKGETKPVQTGETPQTTTTTAGTPEGTIGDVNNDGKVTAADVRYLQDYLLNQSKHAITLDTSDLNGDGVLNGFDLALLRQKLAN